MLPYNINNINVVFGVVIFLGYSSCCRVMALGVAHGRRPMCRRPQTYLPTAVGRCVYGRGQTGKMKLFSCHLLIL